MEVKKSSKSNLEIKKGLFVQLGLVVTLSAMIFAFEYKSYEKEESNLKVRDIVEILDDIELQTQPEDNQEPIDEVKSEQSIEFEVVDNNDIIEGAGFNLGIFQQTGNIGAALGGGLNIPTEEPIIDNSDIIFIKVEQDAAFPGGINEMYKFISHNIKYPEQARTAGTKGMVYLTFVVEKDGSITDIKVQRDIGSGCGEEAVRVIKMMPKWNPALQRNMPVRQQFNIPINFSLKGL